MSLVDKILETSKELMYSLDEANIDVSRKEEMIAYCKKVAKAIKAISADFNNKDSSKKTISELKDILSSLPEICASSIGEEKANSIINRLIEAFDSDKLLAELNSKETEKANNFFILKIDKSAGYFASSADVIEHRTK